jgi:hypothetical protein
MKYSLESLRALIEHSGRRVWCLRRGGQLVSEGDEDNELIYDSLMNMLVHHPHGEYMLEVRSAKNSLRNALQYKFDWGEVRNNTSISGIQQTSPQQTVDNQFIIGELNKERLRNDQLQLSLKEAIEKANDLNLKLTIRVETEKAVNSALAGIPRYEPAPSYTKYIENAANAFGAVVGSFVAPNLQKYGLDKAVAHTLAGHSNEAESEETEEEYEESPIEQVVSKHFRGQDPEKIATLIDALLCDPENGPGIKAFIMAQMPKPKPKPPVKNKIGF